MPGHVDDEAIELKSIELPPRAGLCAPEDGPKPKRQLAGAVGLRDEVVRTELESEYTIDLVVLAGYENDGLGARLGLLAHSLENLGCTHVDELVLDDEASNAVFGEKADCALPVPGRLEVGPARAERLLQRCPERAVTGYDATIYCHHSVRA